jgi:hypothetical protein
MRTKTLLLTAALSAAGIATSMAQVYSVNAVGYVNTTLKPGYNLISNPLNAADNTIPALFAGVPAQTQVYVFDGNTYQTATYFGAALGWNPAAMRTVQVTPGNGVFVRNPGQTDVTLTFVGEVPQGAASNTQVPAGLSIKSSAVPQDGTVSQLGYPAASGDQLYKFNPATQSYTTYSYLGAPLNRWSPSEPTISVGEAVFIRKTAAAAWDRNFNVNS